MKRINKPEIHGQNLKTEFLFLLFLSTLEFCPYATSQAFRSESDELNLIDAGKKIENIISIYTSRSKYELLKSVTGSKISFTPELLVINGDTIRSSELSTRGQTTLNFRRKSYSFDVKPKASFNHGETHESFKKFFTLSLCMDKDYVNNRLAFEMMGVCGIFDLFYSFCELRINDHTEGVYMVIERPEDYALKKMNARILIRRGYNQNLEKIETGKKVKKQEIRNYCQYFRQIYKCLNRYKGEELYSKISELLDLEMYMRWLAFNFLVRNGDYTDEVYFFFNPANNKFGIIPWDYDDLFFSSPHEGSDLKADMIGRKLIFSAEDILDKEIANDPVLYRAYLKQLEEVLERLPAEVMKRIFEGIYAELYPYFTNPEIIGMSEYDSLNLTNTEKLRNDLNNLYKRLKYSRERYLNKLKSDL